MGWNPAFENKDVFDDLLEIIYDPKKEISPRYRDFYDSLDKSPLLKARSEVIRGFKKNKFYLEFSRVFFLLMFTSREKNKFSSIYDSTLPEDPSKLSDNPFEGPEFLPLNACTRACNSFLKLLSEEPM